MLRRENILYLLLLLLLLLLLFSYSFWLSASFALIFLSSQRSVSACDYIYIVLVFVFLLRPHSVRCVSVLSLIDSLCRHWRAALAAARIILCASKHGGIGRPSHPPRVLRSQSPPPPADPLERRCRRLCTPVIPCSFSPSSSFSSSVFLILSPPPLSTPHGAVVGAVP